MKTAAISLWLVFVLTTVAHGNQLLSVVGDVVLTRNDNDYRAVSRSYLDAGDTVTASGQSGFSCVINDVFVYAGPGTCFQVDNGGIELRSGQVRILGRANNQLSVQTPFGQVQTTGGAQLVGVAQNGCEICCQRGTPTVMWPAPSTRSGRQQQALSPQSNYFLHEGQLRPLPSDMSRWNIPVQQLVEQGLAFSQPQGQAPAQAQAIPGQTQPTTPGLYSLNDQSLSQPTNDQSFGSAPLNDQPLAQQQPLDQPFTQQPSDQPFNQQPLTNNPADAFASNDQSLAAPLQQPPFEEEENRAPDASAQSFDQGLADNAAAEAPGESAASQGSQQSTNQGSLASLSNAIGGSSSNFAGTNSGSTNSDANQSTLQGINTRDGGPFPGNIHLLTSETQYTLNDSNGLRVSQAQLDAIAAAGERNYYSIGEGAVPTTQVSTDFLTGTNIQPNAIAIPGFNNFVVELDQFNAVDPASGQPSNLQGVTGLLGENPLSPSVVGATPLTDDRAELNPRATFALGEFRVGQTTNGELEFAVRRSDQDRQIIKDNFGNDANDLVTPNTQVDFVDGVDPRFLPAAPTVRLPAPNSFSTAGTRFSSLSKLRRAAATVVLADQLHDLSRATRQTRFVVDGRIVDISGFRRPGQ